jgi:hypothetical protein
LTQIHTFPQEEKKKKGAQEDEKGREKCRDMERKKWREEGRYMERGREKRRDTRKE